MATRIHDGTFEKETVAADDARSSSHTCLLGNYAGCTHAYPHHLYTAARLVLHQPWPCLLPAIKSRLCDITLAVIAYRARSLMPASTHATTAWQRRTAKRHLQQETSKAIIVHSHDAIVIVTDALTACTHIMYAVQIMCCACACPPLPPGSTHPRRHSAQPPPHHPCP